MVVEGRGIGGLVSRAAARTGAFSAAGFSTVPWITFGAGAAGIARVACCGARSRLGVEGR
ncbi:MAG: hypothetical protein CL569_05240 [Alphaproteobacteria bacterium]|nr:hypothetical protein [Alphaproteobacteria bacterium]